MQQIFTARERAIAQEKAKADYFHKKVRLRKLLLGGKVADPLHFGTDPVHLLIKGPVLFRNQVRTGVRPYMDQISLHDRWAFVFKRNADRNP